MTSSLRSKTKAKIQGRLNWRAYLALLVGIVSISFSAIFVSWANAPGAVTGFYRVAIAVVVLALPFYRQMRQQDSLPATEILVALTAGLFFAGDLIFWNTGILLSGATNPTLLANTAPLWVGLGATIFFRERLNRKFWFGLLLAMLGAAAVLGLDLSDEVGLGTFFGLLAGIFYGGYLLVTQRSRRQLRALTFFWLAGLSSSVILWIAALAMGQPLTGYSTMTYVNFLALGLVAQVMGQLTISYALGHLPASLVSPSLLGQPVLTAVFAIFLLDQIPTMWHLVGGTAVILGVFVVHRSRQP